MRSIPLLQFCLLPSVLGKGKPAAAEVDVVIIGAGLSGLSAAKDLLKANVSVRVLEARGRVGGRVLNHQLKNGGVVELGAEFIGPSK